MLGPLWPLLLLSPALKRWGPPMRQTLYQQHVHIWPISDFVSDVKGWTPHTVAAHLWAVLDFVPLLMAGRVM